MVITLPFHIYVSVLFSLAKVCKSLQKYVKRKVMKIMQKEANVRTYGNIKKNLEVWVNVSIIALQQTRPSNKYSSPNDGHLIAENL